jgi:hypothetical protein
MANDPTLSILISGHRLSTAPARPLWRCIDRGPADIAPPAYNPDYRSSGPGLRFWLRWINRRRRLVFPGSGGGVRSRSWQPASSVFGEKGLFKQLKRACWSGRDGT